MPDPAEAGVDPAQKRFDALKKQIRGDVKDLSHVPRSLFDLVLCTFVFEHVAQFWRAGRTLSRLVKPGGVLVYSTRGTLLNANFGNVPRAIGVAALGPSFVLVTTEQFDPSASLSGGILPRYYPYIVILTHGGDMVRRFNLADLGVKGSSRNLPLVSADSEHVYVSTETKVVILAHGE